VTYIYAHRGASSEVLENTASAFNRAVEYSIDGIETDVQLTKDGVAVLWHDRYLQKLGFQDLRVGDVEADWLQQIDLADCSSTVKKGERLLSLQQFTEAFRDKCRLLLEIKNRDWDRLSGRHQINVQKCLQQQKAAANTGFDDGFIISSFDLDSLVYAHGKDTGQALILNLDTGFSIAEIDSSLGQQKFLYGYCLPIDDLDEALTNKLKDSGKNITVYTCNTREQIIKALRLQVDILISDYPGVAVELRE